MYKCVNCKHEITSLEDKIRCPFCGARVLVKLRPEKLTRVLAR